MGCRVWGVGCRVYVTVAGVVNILHHHPPRGNVKRFRGGLVSKGHRWLYHSTLGSRVIKKKKKKV